MPAAKPEIPADHLAFEVDGPGVDPSNVDARLVLEAAAAYFELVVQVARQRGVTLALRGISIVDKCLAIVSVPDAPAEAREAAVEAAAYVSGQVRPTRGVIDATRRTRDAVRVLGDGFRFRTVVGGSRQTPVWSAELLLPTAPAPVPPRSGLSVRAHVVRVGGSEPTIRLTSPSEPDPFSLQTTQALAQRIGAYLYRDVDILATVTRDATGAIVDGELEDFEPLADEGDEDPAAPWRAWYREAAADWDDVEDVERELVRD